MSTLLQSGGGPDGSPGGGTASKRKMEKEGLTLESIRVAIKEELRSERRELKLELLGEVRAEVREQLGDINQILHELQSLHTAQAQTLHRVDQVQQRQQANMDAMAEEQRTLRERLTLLEGKFGQLNTGTLASRGESSSSEEDRRQPALIIGGWDENTPAAETLHHAHSTAAQLRLDIDMEGAFVPGIRRGYAIIPLKYKQDETEGEQRQRVHRMPSKRSGTPTSFWGRSRTARGSAFGLLSHKAPNAEQRQSWRARQRGWRSSKGGTSPRSRPSSTQEQSGSRVPESHRPPRPHPRTA